MVSIKIILRVVKRFIFGIDQILRVESSADKFMRIYLVGFKLVRNFRFHISRVIYRFLVMGIGLILVLVPIMIHSWAGQYRIDSN